jgi:hypothetical protein
MNNDYLQKYDYLNLLFQQTKTPTYGDQASAIKAIII